MQKKNFLTTASAVVLVIALAIIIPKYLVKGIAADPHITGPALSLASHSQSPHFSFNFKMAVTKIDGNDVYVSIYTFFGIKSTTILIKNLKVAGPESDYGYTYDSVGLAP